MVRPLRARLSIAFATVGVLLAFGGWMYNAIEANVAARTAKDAVAQIRAEGKERRSQTCYSFESGHLEEVRRLESIYRYLRDLPAGERESFINRTIIKSVPGLERDARSDQDQHGVFVPLFCDEPNTGLPEPDPVVPKRPPLIDRLVKEQARK